jgi:transcription elongation GreA/GreB family factor
MKEPSKSNHIGWERVHLERIRVLEDEKKQTENELLSILDRLTNESTAYKQRKSRQSHIESQIQELREKVEYHLRSQMRGSEE